MAVHIFISLAGLRGTAPEILRDFRAAPGRVSNSPACGSLRITARTAVHAAGTIENGGCGPQTPGKEYPTHVDWTGVKGYNRGAGGD